MTRHDWNTDTITSAAQRMRSGGKLYESCYPTSECGDVALITWHLIYHTGHAPKGVRAGRGHSLVVMDALGNEVKNVRVTDAHDHRNGVTGFGYSEGEE